MRSDEVFWVCWVYVLWVRASGNVWIIFLLGNRVPNRIRADNLFSFMSQICLRYHFISFTMIIIKYVSNHIYNKEVNSSLELLFLSGVNVFLWILRLEQPCFHIWVLIWLKPNIGYKLMTKTGLDGYSSHPLSYYKRAIAVSTAPSTKVLLKRDC